MSLLFIEKRAAGQTIDAKTTQEIRSLVDKHGSITGHETNKQVVEHVGRITGELEKKFGKLFSIEEHLTFPFDRASSISWRLVHKQSKVSFTLIPCMAIDAHHYEITIGAMEYWKQQLKLGR